MRQLALAFVTIFALSSMTTPVAAFPKMPRPSAAKSDGVWQKTYGWGGYGWYSIYGDFVGTDGYTYIAPRYRTNYPGGPARPRLQTWVPPSGTAKELP